MTNLRCMTAAGVLAGFVFSVSATRAADVNDPAFVPFVLPWDDGAAGPTDLSFLNHMPAGKLGPITAGEDGHLHAGAERVRFLGVNVCFAGNVPEKVDADKIAARMAKFGINVVRFHHSDGGDFPNGLIKRGSKRSGELDPQALDRFDFFMSRLKAHGIYANINLLISRRFSSGDGLPAEIDRLDTKLRHAIAIYDPGMIELQKQYARDLLGHRNSHTGMSLAADPAVAFVEINNENGLVQKWLENDLDDLPAPFAGELGRQWNLWLKHRYADTSALGKAWKVVNQPLGREMFLPLSENKRLGGWYIEQNGRTRASVTVEPEGGAKSAAIRIDVEAIDDQSWHVQLPHPALRVRADQPYTLTFRAKADPGRTIVVALQQAHDPWGGLGLSTPVKLTSAWSEHRFTFTPSADDANARINFGELGRHTGKVWIADMSLRPGGAIGPSADETIEKGSLRLVSHSGAQAWPGSAREDYVRFLRATETSYWLAMRQTIKEELGFRGIVMGTIVGCSPLTVQAQLDAVDGHAYWQHPHFPGRPWDSENWTVRNVSMVNEPGGELTGLSMQRVAGKPFTVTEYNHPAPNSFGSEGPLLLATQAAFQDWDGIFMFAYSHSTRWKAGMMDSFFDIDKDPAKMANMAAAALIFRAGQVSPGQEAVVRDLSPDQEADLLTQRGRAWSLLNLSDLGVPRATALLHRTAVRITDAKKGAAASKESGKPDETRLVSDTGQVTWDRSEKNRGVVTIDAPRIKAVIGFRGQRSFMLGPVNFMPAPKGGAEWSTMCLAMLEGDSFTKPGRALLIMTGRAENTNMHWTNAEHNSVGREWGQAPTRIEPIAATVRLPLAPSRNEVWSLDEHGQRLQKMKLTGIEGGSIFVTGEQPTLWYELVIR